MKPISIYALTRETNKNNIQRLERQLSRRQSFLSVKTWELLSIRRLLEHLGEHLGRETAGLEFFYSFQIPKLGKEFDLLRIGGDTVINVELKSEAVTDEKIRRQLLQNRYYLSSLGKTMRSYTYISSEDRLVRLTGKGNIVPAEWAQLCEDLRGQTELYTDHIEALFRAEQFIISPLSDPDRFLKKEYFLTSQQRDIERHILRELKLKAACVQGITGLPGTGKTLLLYDLAMLLSQKQRVCVIHGGSYPGISTELDTRLKRVVFLNAGKEVPKLLPEDYAAVLVDEGQWLDAAYIKALLQSTAAAHLPVIFSYAQEEAISPAEVSRENIRFLKAAEGYEEYCLTNRIRTNEEVSSFIQRLLHSTDRTFRREYANIRILYANDREEAELLLEQEQKKGYVFLAGNEQKKSPGADSRGYEKVVQVLDSRFYYDNEKYLRSEKAGGESPVRMLFHDLNRAKEALSLVVLGNEAVLDELLKIVQGTPGK